MSALESPPVAKKKPSDKAPTQAAQIPIDILKMARAIVGIRGGSVGTLIAEQARAGLRKIIDDMHKRGEFTNPPPE